MTIISFAFNWTGCSPPFHSWAAVLYVLVQHLSHFIMFFQERHVETSRKQPPPALGGPRPALSCQAAKDGVCDRWDRWPSVWTTCWQKPVSCLMYWCRPGHQLQQHLGQRRCTPGWPVEGSRVWAVVVLGWRCVTHIVCVTGVWSLCCYCFLVLLLSLWTNCINSLNRRTQRYSHWTWGSMTSWQGAPLILQRACRFAHRNTVF